MKVTYEYDERLNGAKIVATGSQAQAITTPDDLAGGGTFYSVSIGDYVIGTGVFFEWLGVLWAQTRNGLWVNVYNSGTYNYTATENAYSKQTKSPAESQRYVNKVIDCNKQIVANNILCARFSGKFTSSERKQIYDLQKRLEARNNALLNDGLVTNQTTDYPQGYVYLQSYLDKFMADGGVGSATVAIVIAAVVIASLSTAAYFAYKSYADEAERDLQYSKKLTATLTAKLTDAEYKQLLNETNGILTRAKIRASIKGSNKILLALAVALSGYFIYDKFIQ